MAQRFQRCDKIGRPINLGELSLEHGNAHVQASTDLQTFGMIVPAEPYFAATEPGDMVVMEVRPLPGHKDPEIHLKMLAHDFPFDTVQMPLNCFDATLRSFETHVLPEAIRRGIAVLGMKSLGGSGETVRHGGITAQQGLRYAMSLPVATTVSGIDSMEVLDQNLAVATNFQPFTAAELKELRDQCR